MTTPKPAIINVPSLTTKRVSTSLYPRFQFFEIGFGREMSKLSVEPCFKHWQTLICRYHFSIPYALIAVITVITCQVNRRRVRRDRLQRHRIRPRRNDACHYVRLQTHASSTSSIHTCSKGICLGSMRRYLGRRAVQREFQHGYKGDGA